MSVFYIFKGCLVNFGFDEFLNFCCEVEIMVREIEELFLDVIFEGIEMLYVEML